MENAINQRIKVVLDFYSMSETQLAKTLGLSQPTVNRQIKGENQVSIEFVNSILYSFNDISAEWLMRGEGEMLKSKHSSQLAEYNKSDMDLIRELREDKKMFSPITPDELSGYWARHTWATIAAQLDIPVEIIGHALGHADTGHRVTNIYIDFNSDKIDQANRTVLDSL